MKMLSSWKHCTFWLHSQNSFLWVQFPAYSADKLWFSGSHRLLLPASKMSSSRLSGFLFFIHHPLSVCGWYASPTLCPMSPCRILSEKWVWRDEQWTWEQAIQPFCHETNIYRNLLRPGNSLDTIDSKPWCLSLRVRHQKPQDTERKLNLRCQGESRTPNQENFETRVHGQIGQDQDAESLLR